MTAATDHFCFFLGQFFFVHCFYSFLKVVIGRCRYHILPSCKKQWNPNPLPVAKLGLKAHQDRH